MTTRAVSLGALPHIVADETMSRSELRAILHATFHKLALYEGCGSQRKAHEWIRERIPAKDWPFVKTLLPVPKKTGRGKLKNSRGTNASKKDLEIYNAYCRARTDGVGWKQFIEKLASAKFTGDKAFSSAEAALRRAKNRLSQVERVAIEVVNEIRADRLVWNNDGGKRSLERLRIRSKN